jgi:hypothetical protein
MSPSSAHTYVDIDINVNFQHLQKMLMAVDTAVSPVGMAAFMGNVVDPYLRRRARARFASEGDDASGVWDPLQPATVMIRESEGYPGEHPINRRSGQLEEYITETPGAVSMDPAFTSLTMPGKPATGTLASKYQTAQQGSTSNPRARNPTPARPVLALDTTDFLFVMAELTFWVQTAIGGGRPAP